MNKFKLFDVVAILHPIPEKKLSSGQVGTIVEVLADNVYEIEFIGNNGETLTTASVNSQNMLLLHYELETV